MGVFQQLAKKKFSMCDMGINSLKAEECSFVQKKKEGERGLFPQEP
jgi:hypothetical protein